MNKKSDGKAGKGSRGFYAALGISAVMIGSACFFAYNEGEKMSKDKLSNDSKITTSEAAVDHKYSDIPKTTHVTTAPPVTIPPQTVPAVTLPAADIVQDIPAVKPEPPTEEKTTEAVTEESSKTGSAMLENVHQPLAEINVQDPYSAGELVKNETTGAWQTHNGTDYAAAVGTDVFAVSPGEVTEVTNDQLWGVTVTINHHNGFITKYCGLGSDLSVQAGDTVVSGDVIGAVGETADIESSSEPHLHLEITHNGMFVDPVSVLK